MIISIRSTGGLIGDGPDQWRATTTSCFSFERVGPCQAIAELQVGEVCSRPRFGDHGFYPSFHSDSGCYPSKSVSNSSASGRHRRQGRTRTYSRIPQARRSCCSRPMVLGSVISHGCMPLNGLRPSKEDPDVVCIFFTTMPVLHVLYQERFITYHISGRKRLDGFEAREWNTIVEEMLRIVIEAHNPTTFVFDGAFPYRGMLEAIGDYGNLRKIWVRRGTMKARSSIPVDSEDFFERIVVPGDVEDGEPTETGGELRVPFYVVFEPDESLGRIQARRTLGLAIESMVRVCPTRQGTSTISTSIGRSCPRIAPTFRVPDRHRGIDARSEDTGGS